MCVRTLISSTFNIFQTRNAAQLELSNNLTEKWVEFSNSIAEV